MCTFGHIYSTWFLLSVFYVFVSFIPHNTFVISRTLSWLIRVMFAAFLVCDGGEALSALSTFFSSVQCFCGHNQRFCHRLNQNNKQLGRYGSVTLTMPLIICHHSTSISPQIVNLVNLLLLFICDIELLWVLFLLFVFEERPQQQQHKQFIHHVYSCDFRSN